MPAAYENWGASVPHGVEAHFFPECKSTNEIAADYARENKASPIWIIAGSQSGGKGRKGRTWVSERGNLYASLLFRPAIKPADMNALPFLIALAVRDTLVNLEAPPADVQCKWPNDILLNGQKISGILIESSTRSSDALDYVIVGIGINLRHSPRDALFPATSLEQSLDRHVSVDKALKYLSRNVKDRLDAWDTKNFESIRSEWTGTAWGLGESRKINTANEAFAGKLVGLDAQGALLVQLSDGSSRQILAADIFPASSLANEDTY